MHQVWRGPPTAQQSCIFHELTARDRLIVLDSPKAKNQLVPQMTNCLRTSVDHRAHAIINHDALGGFADVHRATLRRISCRKWIALRRPLRIQSNRDSFGAHAVIEHDALGGLADVHRMHARNV